MFNQWEISISLSKTTTMCCSITPTKRGTNRTGLFWDMVIEVGIRVKMTQLETMVAQENFCGVALRGQNAFQMGKNTTICFKLQIFAILSFWWGRGWQVGGRVYNDGRIHLVSPFPVNFEIFDSLCISISYITSWFSNIFQQRKNPAFLHTVAACPIQNYWNGKKIMKVNFSKSYFQRNCLWSFTQMVIISKKLSVVSINLGIKLKLKMCHL